MNKFDEIQAFVAVVESGSFTAAGRRLETTKSVLSRRVALLEDRLGVQLLHRTTRAQTLTDSGAEYFEHCKRILDDLNEVESTLSQQHDALTGRLRLALPLSFGVRHMCGPIASFQNLHPDLTFDLDLSDRHVDLIEQGIDMALRIGEMSDSSLVARRLFAVRMVACASSAYLHKNPAPQSHRELQAHRCLVYAQSSAPEPWAYRDKGGQNHKIEMSAAMVSSSGDFLCNAAAHGQGIVLLPTFIVAETVRSGKLQPVLRDYDWPGVSAYAVYPPTRHLSHRVRAFIDFLSERFSVTPQWDKDCGLDAQ